MQNTTLMPSVVEIGQLSSVDNYGGLEMTAKPLDNVIVDTSTEEYDDYDRIMSNMSYDEYIDEVVEHIYPVHYEWVFIVFSSLVLVVGLLGNFLVCYVVFKNFIMQTVTNIFIVNLAIADFCVLLFCLPPTVIWDVTETWFFGTLACKLIVYFQARKGRPKKRSTRLQSKESLNLQKGVSSATHKLPNVMTVSVSVSVLTLAAIGVDRWYAICTPLKFKSTPARAKCITIVIWFISILLGIPEIIYLDTKSYKFIRTDIHTVYMTTCMAMWGEDIERKFTIFKFVSLFLLPLTFIAVTYIQIIKVLWRQEMPHETSRSRLSLAIELQIRSRRKAAKMLVAVVVMFALCYLPVHLISIGRIFLDLPNNDTNKIISQLSHFLIYANSAINPLIYNFMSGKFRREFRRAMLCLSAPNNAKPCRLYYRTTSTRTHTAL